MSDKKTRLLDRVNWDRPELAAIRDAADPAAAFVDHLRRTRRAPYLVELERLDALRDFAREHYPAMRDYKTGPCEAIEQRTLEAARGPRALADLRLLGQGWLMTGDARWGTAFERFYVQSETGDMFNWGAFNGTQPVGELAAWLLLRDCPSLTTAGQVAYWDHTCTIMDNAWDVHTSTWEQTMLGTEGHNWYLHGVHGLVTYGLLFPEFKRADFLLRTAMSVFEEYMRGHHKADGGARETCLGYQNGSLNIVWEIYLLARRNGWALAPDFGDRLLNATRYLLDLMTPDGSIASVGDGGHHPGAFTRIASIAAAISGDATCKWYAERCRGHQPGTDSAPGVLPQAAFWMVGLEGAATYERIRPRAPHAVSVLKGLTGYAALRSDWSPTADFVHIAAADRGPIVTSHGHNDIFSLEVHANGQRFLGEQGCAPYGTTPGRDYDQLTEAHNCFNLDGEEQVDLLSEWRWSQTVTPAVRRWIAEPTHTFFHGVHEGYYRWPDRSIVYARKVLQLNGKPGYSLVFDWLLADTEEPVSASSWWHGVVAGAIEGNTIRLSGAESDLVITPPAGDAVTLTQELGEGLQAYIAERKLDAATYPCFRYQAKTGRNCFIWLIAPVASGAAAPTITRLPLTLNGSPTDAFGATAVQVTQPGQTDTIIVSHRDWDADLATADLAGWGHLFIRRRGETNLDITHTMADGIVGR